MSDKLEALFSLMDEAIDFMQSMSENEVDNILRELGVDSDKAIKEINLLLTIAREKRAKNTKEVKDDRITNEKNVV